MAITGAMTPENFRTVRLAELWRQVLGARFGGRHVGDAFGTMWSEFASDQTSQDHCRE